MVPDFKGIWSNLGVLIPEPLDWRALAWSFVPGLGHLKTGRPRLGRILLPGWIIMLALALIGIATPWARYALAGMIALHTLALVSLFAANLAYERLLMRAAFGLFVYVSLHFFAYEPALWLCTRFLVATSIHWTPRGSVVESGDGLLFEGPWIRPARFARGDTVLYRLERLELTGFILRAGLSVDRVVGVPGDRVQREHGMLLVNGRPPADDAGPLGRVPLGAFDFQLGPREYAVFTTFGLRNPFAHLLPNQRVPPSMVRRLSVVAYDDIVGRVVLRLRPLSRFGPIG